MEYKVVSEWDAMLQPKATLEQYGKVQEHRNGTFNHEEILQ